MAELGWWGWLGTPPAKTVSPRAPSTGTAALPGTEPACREKPPEAGSKRGSGEQPAHSWALGRRPRGL